MPSRKQLIKFAILIVVGMIGYISYQEEGNHPTSIEKRSKPKGKAQIIQKSLDYEDIQSTTLRLNTRPNSGLIKGDINANLFGKFFYDRAEFYIIKNPQNKIHYAQTESITLFYLDGKLCQTKYVLENNIVSYLLKEFGSFKIKGFDIKNRDIILSENHIIQKEGQNIMMNKNLDNYLLEWSFENKVITYRVNTSVEHNSFEYLEKTANYEQEYLAVEKNIF